MTKTLFLHGLDSSSQGSKGSFFSKYFTQVLCPDFDGDLRQRLEELERLCAPFKNITLIGSSFGGLMATSFAISHPHRVHRLILLAPALNFAGFQPPSAPISTPTLLIMGSKDTVCPPGFVLPIAKETFTDLEIRSGDDDHLLKKMFLEIDWRSLLAEEDVKSSP